MSYRVGRNSQVPAGGDGAVEPASQEAQNVQPGIPGLALDREGDLPIPCAVLRVDIDEKTHTAMAAHYIYASTSYCKALSRDLEGVVGRSHAEVGEGDEVEWLAKCYRVVTDGETVDGFGYDPLVRDWTCFTLSPSANQNCCVHTFMRLPVDDRRRRQLMSTADARTSLFISEMLSELAAEQDYHAAMNGMLSKMSEVIHANRLSVFELRGNKMRTSFELLGEGVEPQLGTEYNVSTGILDHWFRNVTHDSVVLVPNVSVIERFSEPLYRWCRASGADSLLAAPFFSDGEIVGFLGAYNYQIDETVDLNRLFEAVSTFIAARIENKQLIGDLKRASSHDSLTGLLNRRGLAQAADGLFASDAYASHVLALLDLDDFKRINDVYGHGAGDEALRAMARTMERAFPTEAIRARNGGDEFIVILSGDAARNASALLASFVYSGLEFDFEERHHRLTISAGYARCPEQASNMHDLLLKADTALYAVKQSGKAGFGKYTPDAEERMRIRLGFSAHDVLTNAPYLLLISRANAQGELLFASNELASWLGYASMYELMRFAGSYEGIVYSDDREIAFMAIRQQSLSEKDRSTKTHRFRLLTKEGNGREVRASFRFVHIKGSGKVLYTYFIPVETD